MEGRYDRKLAQDPGQELKFPNTGSVPYSVTSHWGKESVGKEKRMSANIGPALNSRQAQCQELYFCYFDLFLINNPAYSRHSSFCR